MPLDYRLRSLFDRPEIRDRFGLPPLDGGPVTDAAPTDNGPPPPLPSPGVSSPPAPAPADDALPKNVADFQAQQTKRDAMLAALKDAQGQDTRTRFFNTLGAAFTQGGNAFSGRNRAPVQAPVTAVQDVLTQQKLGAGLDQEARANAAEGRAAQLFGPELTSATAKAKYAGDEAAADAAMKNSHAQLFGQQATKGAADLEESERQRQEAHDPSSVTSKVGMQLAQQAGLTIPPGTAYAAYRDLLPLATKNYIAQETAKARLEGIKYAADVRANAQLGNAPGGGGGRGGGSGSGGGDRVSLLADGIEQGTIAPDLKGMPRSQASAVTAELQRRGFNVVRAQTEYAANTQRVKTLNAPQQTRLRQASSSALEMLDNIEGLYNEWDQIGGTSRFPVLNSASLATAKQLPGRAGAVARALEANIADLSSDLGSIYQSGNAATNESLKLAEKNLVAGSNPEQFRESLKQARRNIGYRLHSIETTGPAGTETNRYAQPAGGGTASSGGKTADPLGIR